MSVRLEVGVKFFLSLLFLISVALLQRSDHFLTISLDSVEVVIGELAPVRLDVSL